MYNMKLQVIQAWFWSLASDAHTERWRFMYGVPTVVLCTRWSNNSCWFFLLILFFRGNLVCAFSFVLLSFLINIITFSIRAMRSTDRQLSSYVIYIYTRERE